MYDLNKKELEFLEKVRDAKRFFPFTVKIPGDNEDILKNLQKMGLVTGMLVAGPKSERNRSLFSDCLEDIPKQHANVTITVEGKKHLVSSHSF